MEKFIFSPGKIILAIVFHLLDEKIADIIDPSSVETAMTALRNWKYPISVRKSFWREIDNQSRLDYLLLRAQIDVVLTEVPEIPDNIILATLKERF